MVECPICKKKKLFYVELKTEIRAIMSHTLMRGVCVCIDCLRNPEINVEQAFISVGKQDIQKERDGHLKNIKELNKLLRGLKSPLK